MPVGLVCQAPLRRSRAATAAREEQGEAVVEGASVATAVLEARRLFLDHR